MPGDQTPDHILYFELLEARREGYTTTIPTNCSILVQESKRHITEGQVDEAFRLLDLIESLVGSICEQARFLTEENHKFALQANMEMRDKAEFVRCASLRDGETENAVKAKACLDDIDNWLARSITYLSPT